MTNPPRPPPGSRAKPALAAGEPGAWLASPRSPRRWLRPIAKLSLVLPWTALCASAQAVALLLPGNGKTVLPRLYWSGLCTILRLRIRITGAIAHPTPDGRPVVYVSNHSSWLDILVLGARLDACFSAKEEVAKWPLIGTIARLGRTVYVRRKRNSTARERDEMRARLAAGDNLVLFPEGTTSDGARVLPFRSAFLSIAEIPATSDGKPPIVQPISLVYDRLAGLPTGRVTRPILAWYGDMEIASHYWQLARHGGLRATLLMHPPIDPCDFPDRKALAQAIWRASADGAATLRQNRPADPAPLRSP
ncbi:MAG: 1-acyl-sn-glycerol-3-phosphate acyltransferase [Acetobacteraceae bacterium]|nr:1-acyl-sn-glycerol-3-phosphate acyltransferase [Acetobacteraceae bacterium]